MVRQAFVVLGLVVLAAFSSAGPASAASPWDGEWEGQLTQSRLPCSPCKVRLTVQDGVPNIRSDVSIPNFVIDASGQVSGQISARNAESAAECSLRGSISGDTLTAGGKCINATAPQMVLKRISSSAGLPAPPPPQARAPQANVPAPSSPGTTTRQQTTPSPSTTQPTFSSSIGAGTQPVRLGDVSFAMEPGTQIGEFQTGSWLSTCGSGKTVPLKLTPAMQPNSTSTRIEFDKTLRAAGYTPGNPLGGSGIPAAYLVIGRVTQMRIVMCLREGTNPPQVSGSGSITFEWHIVAAQGGQPLFQTTTDGRFDLPTGDRQTDGIGAIFRGTYDDAMRKLVLQQGFHNALSGAAPTPRSQNTSQALAVRPAPRMQGGITGNMDRILLGVVEIRTSNGLGSGFVVDPAGYILTNAHVVGSKDVVKVVFSDKSTAEGTVVRRDTIRDIALVQVDRQNLRPLAMRPGKLTLTEKVYAVGSPLGLSQTVTEGIVSAYRQNPNDGQDYIQASANVTFGNSGGPLLDANGNVVGVAVSVIGGGQLGLNMFIPIESALSHLDLRLAGR